MNHFIKILIITVLLIYINSSCSGARIVRSITIHESKGIILNEVKCKKDDKLLCGSSAILEKSRVRLTIYPYSQKRISDFASIYDDSYDQNRVPSLFYILLRIDNTGNSLYKLNRNEQLVVTIEDNLVNSTKSKSEQSVTYRHYHYLYRSPLYKPFRFEKLFITFNLPFSFDEKNIKKRQEKILEEAKEKNYDLGEQLSVKEEKRNLHKLGPLDQIEIPPGKSILTFLAWPKLRMAKQLNIVICLNKAKNGEKLKFRLPIIQKLERKEK